MNKWDQRYRNATAPGEPGYALREYSCLLPKAGVALDLACGLGADALLLAQHGLDVCAWDSSQVAIEKLRQFAAHRNLNINTQCRDVSAAPPPPASFDIIHVSHFLERELCASISAALRPGGLLFYQTFCAEKVDTSHGPSNPDFLLQRNELLRLFESLRIVVYQELGTIGATDKGLRDRALLVAQKA